MAITPEAHSDSVTHFPGTPQDSWSWKQRCINAATIPGGLTAGICVPEVELQTDPGNGAGKYMVIALRPKTICFLRFVLDHATAIASKEAAMSAFLVEEAGMSAPAVNPGVSRRFFSGAHIFDLSAINVGATPILVPSTHPLAHSVGESAMADDFTLANIRTNVAPVKEGGNGATVATLKFDPDGARYLVLGFNVGTAAGIRVGVRMR